MDKLHLLYKDTVNNPQARPKHHKIIQTHIFCTITGIHKVPQGQNTKPKTLTQQLVGPFLKVCLIRYLLALGFGTAAVTDSGTELVGKHKKHHHHNKRGGNPLDNTNGINSTSVKENDAQSSAGSNISDDDTPNIPGVRRKAS